MQSPHFHFLSSYHSSHPDGTHDRFIQLLPMGHPSHVCASRGSSGEFRDASHHTRDLCIPRPPDTLQVPPIAVVVNSLVLSACMYPICIQCHQRYEILITRPLDPAEEIIRIIGCMPNVNYTGAMVTFTSCIIVSETGQYR